MHGASHNVSITTNVIDECSQTLFGGNVIHQEIDNTLYEVAMIEAFDFLNAEVLPSYEMYLEKILYLMLIVGDRQSQLCSTMSHDVETPCSTVQIARPY
jgi:hypothetical protein